MTTKVSMNLAKFLSKEVCKDLDYSEIYDLAEEALTRRFTTIYDVETLCEHYGERYDYVFLANQVEPF